jgi:hypothetical protein
MKKNLGIISLGILFLLTGCFAKTTTKEVSTVQDIDVKIAKDDALAVEYMYNDNDEIILSVTNNSNNNINYVYVDMAFFDKDDNLIKVEKQYIHNIAAGANNLVKVSLYDTNSDEAKLPYRIDIVLNTTIYETEYESVYTNQVTGSVVLAEEGRLNLNILNNSGVVLDEVTATVVFYKEGKIIDISQVVISNVEASATGVVYIPVVETDGVYNSIDYDDVQVVINNASKSNV